MTEDRLTHSAPNGSAIEPTVIWTDAKIKAFWEFEQAVRAHTFFSRKLKRALAKEIAKAAPDGGRVLDYGCGTGDLAAELAKRFRPVVGADLDETLMVRARELHGTADRLSFMTYDALDQVGHGGFDLVTSIEVVEHLPDSDLVSYLAKLKSYLKPGGVAVVTTPADETLSHSYMRCPDCAVVFHAVQHVRSWTEASLSQALERQGFRVIRAYRTNFTWKQAYPRLGTLLCRLAPLLGRTLPDLVVIARA